MSRLPITLGVAGTVIVLDQATKVLAVARLEGSPPVEVLGQVLQLHFVRNPGAAFSLGGGYTILISALAIGVSVAIVRTARTLTNVWWAVVLGGVLGGALGNLIDRLLRSPGPLRGHVVDFLALPHWPIFNIADMSLVLSAVLAVILTVVGVDLSEPAPGEPAPGEAPAVATDPAAADQPRTGRAAGDPARTDPADG